VTLTPADIDRLLDLARHERADVATRALDILRDERLARSHDYAALAALVEQVWDRDVWVAIALSVTSVQS